MALEKQNVFKDIAIGGPVKDTINAIEENFNSLINNDNYFDEQLDTKISTVPDGSTSFFTEEDGNLKINLAYIPSSISTGATTFIATFDPSSKTNTTFSEANRKGGSYWIASTTGTYLPDGTETSNNDAWVNKPDDLTFNKGDWAILVDLDGPGTKWSKIDNSDLVTSVNGRIGAIETYRGTWTSTATYKKGDIVLGPGTDNTYYYSDSELGSGSADINNIVGQVMWLAIADVPANYKPTLLNYTNTDSTIKDKWYPLYSFTGLANTTKAGLMSKEKFVEVNTLSTSISNITSGATIIPKATIATTATKLGSETIGNVNQPIYLSSGVPTKGSLYAGGTSITLNGSSKSGSSTTIYAPENGGTSEDIVQWDKDTSEPVWVKPITLTVGKAYSDAEGNTITSTYATKTELNNIAATAGKIDSIDFVTGTATTGYVVPITDKVAKPKIIGSGVDIITSSDGVKIKSKASNTVGEIKVNGAKPTHTSTVVDSNGGTYSSVNLEIVSGDTSTTTVSTDSNTGKTTITALGKVRDVTVNGSSVVTDGTAAITIDDLEGDIINIFSSDAGTWDGTTISKWGTIADSSGTYYAIQIPIKYATTFEVYPMGTGKAIVTQNMITTMSGDTVVQILVGASKDNLGYVLRKIKGNAVSTSGSSNHLYQHKIYVQLPNNQGFFYLNIYNSSATEYTEPNKVEWGQIPVNGVVLVSSVWYSISYIEYDNTSMSIHYNGKNSASTDYANLTIVTDTVTQIF